MDFDAIESLNEKEVTEFYDEFNSGVLIGHCTCFGERGVAGFFGNGSLGGCFALLVQEGWLAEGCDIWCRSVGLRSRGQVDDRCWCFMYWRGRYGGYTKDGVGYSTLYECAYL